MPKVDRRLGLFFDVGYTQPQTSGTSTDPRVTANCNAGVCMESYTVTARDLGFTLGVHYFQPYNEPNMNDEQPDGKVSVDRYLDNWVAAAQGSPMLPRRRMAAIGRIVNEAIRLRHWKKKPTRSPNANGRWRRRRAS